MKPTTIFVALISLLFVYNLMSQKPTVTGPPIEKTIPNLMEQVRGDAIHWNEKGERWTKADRRAYVMLSPDRRAKRWAVQDIGKLGEEAKEVVPELIQLLQDHGDFSHGKGAVPFRADIARALGRINDPRGAKVLVELLRDRAMRPDDPSALLQGTKTPCFLGGDLVWHVEQKHLRYKLKNQWGSGIGPEGIVDGLVLFGSEHHKSIRTELALLSLDLKSVDLHNDWTQHAITKGIEFFEASQSEQEIIRNSVID